LSYVGKARENTAVVSEARRPS